MAKPSRAVLICVCLLLIALPAAAQEDNGKDHPRIPRMPGYVIGEATATDFDAFEFEVKAETTRRVEGRSWRINYALKEGAKVASPLEIARNYLNQSRQKGGQSVYQNVDSSGGTATMTMPGTGGGEVWIGLEIANNGELYTLAIIETAPMQQKVEFSADQMAEQMASSGRIALYGIVFDTARAEIKPASNALLDEVAKMLQGNMSVKIAIEGHTDNVGQKAANLELSRRRAAAVKAGLVARGVAAERLASEGFGDTKPVADNSTEEGRAKNRRVELAKK